MTVVPVYWTTTPVDPPEALANTMAKVATYFDTASNGDLRYVTDRVLPWTRIELTKDQIDSCDYTAVERQARTAAGETPKTPMHHVVAVMEFNPWCWWGGLGTVGPSAEGDAFVWINYTPYEESVFEHEFGHNMGLWHSGSLSCWAPGRTTMVTMSYDCEQHTYADPWDLMGSASYTWFGQIATINKQRIGLLAAPDNPLVTTSRELRLLPVASTSGLRGFSLQVDQVTYHVEYRTAEGLDRWTDDMTYDDHGVVRTAPGGGLVIRREDPDFGQWGEIDVLDFHPDADPDNYYWHPGMEPGQSFTIPGTPIVITLVSADPSGATVDVDLLGTGVERWDGADRFAASAAISRKSFPPGVPTAYVASGRVFSDALSGAPVAGKDKGPLLLVDTDEIPPAIQEELWRLAPRRIVILGGTATVSEGVARALDDYTRGPVERLAGADRYAASATISRRSFDPGVDTAFVASGLVFPDALSGAPAAGATPAPVLLVKTDQLPAPIFTELRRLRPKRIVVLGGPATVTPRVAGQLAAYTDGAVVRWDGKDRYAASAAISAHAFPGGARTVYVASGLVFTDALSGAPVAGATPGPVLLVSSDRIPSEVAAELDRLDPQRVVVLGGPLSVSGGVEAELARFVAPEAPAPPPATE